MADIKKYILDGYRFDDSASYEQARRELARIADIKSERNLREEESLREVYDTLVESEEFETPVGIGFLREAQKRLVKNPVPDAKEAVDTEAQNQVSTAEAEKNLSIINSLRAKIRNYRIIIAFLIIMVIVPFGVLFYDKVINPNLAEESLVNEYASWKEELTKKEQELNEREQILDEMRMDNQK